MSTVLAKKITNFKVGADSYKLKVELSKKRKMSDTSTNFKVDGKDYTINWTYKSISGPGASWRIEGFHSQGLYPIYKSLLSRGFKDRAKYIKSVIESRFQRIGYYVYTLNDSIDLPRKEINKVLTLLKEKKVSFIHTKQDYRPRKQNSGQRCIIHFDRAELPKLIGEEAYKKLNPEFAERTGEFEFDGLKFSDIDGGPDYSFIYWAESISIHYEMGMQTKKMGLGPLLGQHHLIEKL